MGLGHQQCKAWGCFFPTCKPASSAFPTLYRFAPTLVHLTHCPPSRPRSFYEREQRRQGTHFKWSGLTQEQAGGRGSGGAAMQLAPG